MRVKYVGRAVPPNVWLGTSVEDERVVERIGHLRRIPAAVRFLSCEPVIGLPEDLDLSGIDWVIVGGESGPEHREIGAGWVRSIRRQCRTARVPVFLQTVGWSALEVEGP